MTEFLFIGSIFTVIYTYLGYGLLVKLMTLFIKKPVLKMPAENALPEITHIVACYNEGDILREKITNSLALNYPKNKLKTIFVTDGSNDNSVQIVSSEKQITLYHSEKRAGKLAAINSVIPDVNSEIIVFSDANAFLNLDALRNIAIHFQDKTVGAVAGEKKVISDDKDDAAASGEGLYWKYESWLKQLDFHLYSVVGAAGELFAIRTELYEKPADKLLIEDFITSMTVAKKGYRVAYAPNAFASEKSSESVAEEMKRKIRISAGGLQAVVHLRELMNPFRFGILSFQYVSHRVLRWTLAPLALGVAFLTNIALLQNSKTVFIVLFLGQLVFYGLAIFGFLLKERKIKFKLVFIPFYFTFMNLSVYIAMIRIFKGNYNLAWEKSKRRQ